MATAGCRCCCCFCCLFLLHVRLGGWGGGGGGDLPLRVLTFIPLLFPPPPLQPSSLVESAVVDSRKHFQKAVMSVAGTGPKDESTASPHPSTPHPPASSCCTYFYFPFLFFNESTAVHLLPYCCTVKSNCWVDQEGENAPHSRCACARACVCVYMHEENRRRVWKRCVFSRCSPFGCLYLLSDLTDLMVAGPRWRFGTFCFRRYSQRFIKGQVEVSEATCSRSTRRDSRFSLLSCNKLELSRVHWSTHCTLTLA